MENILIESNDNLIISCFGIIGLLILAKINNMKISIANLNFVTDFFLLLINFMSIGSSFLKITNNDNPHLNVFSHLLEMLCGQGLFLHSYYYKVSGFISMIAFSISFILKFEIKDFHLSFNLISICLMMCAKIIKRDYFNKKVKCRDICQLYSSDLFFVIDGNFKIIFSNSNFRRFLQNNSISEKLFFSNLLTSQIDLNKEYLSKPEINEIMSDLLKKNDQKNIHIFEKYMKSLPERKEKELFAVGNIDFLPNKDEVVYIWKRKKESIKQDKCLNETLNLKLMCRNYAKSIYYIAHELRNPLSCILNLELMDSINKDSFENLNTEYIQPAVISSKLMLNLVNGLLDIGQIETGTFKLAIIDFDLQALMEEVFKIMKFQAKSRSLAMKIEIDPQIKNIKSDPNRVRQIIINLMSNYKKKIINKFLKIC